MSIVLEILLMSDHANFPWKSKGKYFDGLPYGAQPHTEYFMKIFQRPKVCLNNRVGVTAASGVTPLAWTPRRGARRRSFVPCSSANSRCSGPLNPCSPRWETCRPKAVSRQAFQHLHGPAGPGAKQAGLIEFGGSAFVRLAPGRVGCEHCSDVAKLQPLLDGQYP